MKGSSVNRTIGNACFSVGNSTSEKLQRKKGGFQLKFQSFMTFNASAIHFTLSDCTMNSATTLYPTLVRTKKRGSSHFMVRYIASLRLMWFPCLHFWFWPSLFHWHMVWKSCIEVNSTFSTSQFSRLKIIFLIKLWELECNFSLVHVVTDVSSGRVVCSISGKWFWGRALIPYILSQGALNFFWICWAFLHQILNFLWNEGMHLLCRPRKYASWVRLLMWFACE